MWTNNKSSAMQHKRRDKVIEFFDIYGPELHGKPEWSQWFGKWLCACWQGVRLPYLCVIALPYIKNPSNDTTFETFFSKQWVDNYTISLHNFLATTFQNMRKWGGGRCSWLVADGGTDCLISTSKSPVVQYWPYPAQNPAKRDRSTKNNSGEPESYIGGSRKRHCKTKAWGSGDKKGDDGWHIFDP